MPGFHLELGSEGHKFAHHRAIVVNSRTGEHLTRFPINKTDAEIVKSVAEKNPKFLKEEKKIAEEADKKVKALAGLRKVEGETKERNTKRQEEAKKAKKIEAPAEPAKAQAKMNTLDLKVGDSITYGQSSGYMGDGGDGRDVGYSITRKVLKVLGRGKYEVEAQYSSNEPEVFTLTSAKNWLRDTNNGRLTVYKIDGKSKPDVVDDYEGEQAKRLKRLEKSVDKDRDNLANDWTKAPKYLLVELIEKHFSAQGKRMSNIKTATKDKLIEIIRKYKIKE